MIKKYMLINTFIIFIIFFIIAIITIEAQATNTIVSTCSGYYDRPRINNNGEIVWSQQTPSGYQVWSNVRGQISSGNLDREPDINDQGEIIWRFGDGGQGPDGIMSNIRGLIYSEQGGTIDPYYDTHRINNNGEIVWSRDLWPFGERVEEIWSNIRGRLTYSPDWTTNRQLAINDNGEVVYESYSLTIGRNMYDILSTNRGFITNDSAWEWHPDINNGGEVVWGQTTNVGWEIWSSTRGRITNNNSDDFYPSINNSGEIVWQGWDGNDYEIFSSTRGQITNNIVNDTEPHINDSGVITWLTNNWQAVMASTNLPGQCPNGDTTDSDGDGLLDCWEINGIDWDGDGNIDLQLYDVNQDGTIDSTERADPNHKDIYVEIDWMAQHQPNATALNNVINSFANAPVNNPDCTQGIRLHIQTDEEAVAHNDNLAFEPCTGPAGAGISDFDNVKSSNFGTATERADANSINILDAKRLAFYYNLFIHNLLGLGGTSGCAELPGNDFVTSLGSWAEINGHKVGNTEQQAGTFMHELGHNLNLRHGGRDGINCKPNYLSIMSYTRQINNIIVGRPLDYSRTALPTRDEANLSEQAGIGGPFGMWTVYGPSSLFQPQVAPPGLAIDIGNLLPRWIVLTPADQPIDWNKDNDNTDVTVSADINDLDLVPFQLDPCDASPQQRLEGYDDWANIQYNFRNSTDFADGVHLTVLEADEISLDVAVQMSPDSDSDGVVNVLDNCILDSNPVQDDSDGDGIGDVCDNCPNTPNHDQLDTNGDGIGDVCEITLGDLDGDGDVDRDDLSILMSYRNQPASNCPECDLDDDGMITVLDARKLMLLCTRLRCATQ